MTPPRSDITAAFELECNAEHPCKQCDDCCIADAVDDEDDGPDYVYERWHRAEVLG